MNLFKAKTADQLEEKLMNIVNNFSHTVGLKDEVTTKLKNADGHIKLGTMGGLGIGFLGVVGGIASIPLIPAIATTVAVGGFTMAGVAILGGGAGMMAGLSYAGLGKLYSKYQESRLGSQTSQISEQHRMTIEENKFDRVFNNKFHTQTDYKKYSDYISLYDLKEAVKQGDMTRAQELVKGIVSKAEFPEGTKAKKAPLFKEPIADDLGSKLGKFFEGYTNKINGHDHSQKIAKIEKNIEKSPWIAGAAIALAGAGLVATSSALVATGLAVGFATLGYTAIKELHRRVIENRSEALLNMDGNKYIDKMSKELNIDVSILNDVKNNVSIRKDNTFKDDFVKTAENKIKSKIN